MLKQTELPSFPQIDTAKETWELIKKEISRFWDGIKPTDEGATPLNVLSVDVIDAGVSEVRAFHAMDASVGMSETVGDPALMFETNVDDILT